MQFVNEMHIKAVITNIKHIVGFADEFLFLITALVLMTFYASSLTLGLVLKTFLRFSARMCLHRVLYFYCIAPVLNWLLTKFVWILNCQILQQTHLRSNT